jgi:hypothetical protein
MTEVAMKFSVSHQDSYKRGLLLLRTLLGWLYILIPHGFLLFFVGIWSGILGFLAFWAILFTGSYPESWFAFQVKFQRWGARVNASIMNLTDTGASFGIEGASDAVTLELERPERISRGLTILRLLFGVIYVGIPHGFCLGFRAIGSGVLMFLAWFAVLFAGKYPERWHAFNVGTSRWAMRVGFYMLNMTDTYPVFSGKA